MMAKTQQAQSRSAAAPHSQAAAASPSSSKKIAVIRLKGKFSISPDIREALSSLRLNRLYACTLLPDNEATKGMVHACKDFVSFGPVEKESAALLLAKRGKTTGGKRLSAEKKPEEIRKILDEFLAGRKLSELGVSPVFFLSPPKGGFWGIRKSHKPFGPLGKNEDIAGLVSQMA